MKKTPLPWWGWAISVGAHVATVGLALALGRRPAPVPVAPAPGDASLVFIDTEGASAGAARADSAETARGASAHKPTGARAVRDDDGDDGYLPRRKKRAKHDDSAKPDTKAEARAKALEDAAAAKDAERAAKDAERAAMRDAVRKAMLAPEGEGGAKADGHGQGAGGGGKKAGVTARYAGMLDGWFSARVSLRGLPLSWEELKPLSTVVTIQLTPDRHVSGFSISKSSGNAAYDARVSGSMQSVVGSGATLPSPPDDEEVPSQITLRFRCRTQERCS